MDGRYAPEMDLVRSLILDGALEDGVELSDEIVKGGTVKKGKTRAERPGLPRFIIEEVELDGFGPHGGPSKLRISDGLTLVTGENGSGKTHILLAIHWCLFGERGSMDPWLSEADPLGKDLVNWQRRGQDTFKMGVSVVFVFNDSRYKARRSIDEKGSTAEVRKLLDNGRASDAVLPEGLTSETLPYLIFQGEAVMYLASEDPFLSEGALKNV
ncbi:MAG: AAA family ATPase, partial [Thermoplasmatota archaeon]